MSGMVNEKIGGIKRPLMAVGFLLSLGLAQSFAQTATPTLIPTPTPAALSWPQFRFNAQNTGFYQPFDTPNFQQKWVFSLGDPRVTYSSPPVVLGLGTGANPDMLFIGTTQGKLLALDTLSGKQIWSFQTQGEIYSSPAVLRRGPLKSRIFFGSSDGLMRALDVAGNLVWQFQTNDAILSSPAEGLIPGPIEVVIVGSNDGTLYCLPVSGTANPPTPIWTTKLDSALLGKPALSSDRSSIYVGTQKGQLFLISSANGKVLDKMTVDGPVRASPALEKRGTKTFAFFGAGHKFYMVESNGTKLTLDYLKDIGTNVVSSAALSNPSATGIPPNLVLVGSDDGKVHVFSVNLAGSTASQVATFNTGGKIFSSIAASETFFAVGSSSNNILTVRLRDLFVNPVGCNKSLSGFGVLA